MSAIVSFLVVAAWWVVILIAIVGSTLVVLRWLGVIERAARLLGADEPAMSVGERETQLTIYSTDRRVVRAEPVYVDRDLSRWEAPVDHREVPL